MLHKAFSRPKHGVAERSSTGDPGAEPGAFRQLSALPSCTSALEILIALLAAASLRSRSQREERRLLRRAHEHPHQVALDKPPPTFAPLGGIEYLKRATRSQADVGNRTRDLILTMDALCQLSYVGTSSKRIL
jgi:hypothetical protein